MQEYTKEEIRSKLETSQVWLERAVIAIYDRQTYDEQQIHETREQNGRGFSGFDANYLTYIAKWINNGKHLDGKHLSKTRQKMLKYSGQLVRIANQEI